MAAPNVGICAAWATFDQATACEGCSDVDPDVAEEVDALEDALLIASTLLYYRTGRQWPGECQQTVRPCAQSHAYDAGRGVGSHTTNPWQGWCSCGSASACGCSRLPSIELGGYPITTILEVKVDGVAVDPTLYRVDDWRWLVRIDGEPWACCQDMSLASSEEDTFEVTFRYGTGPDVAGVRAAALLGCEVYKACAGSDDCALDPRVRSVVREGITLDMETFPLPMASWRSGIKLVDDWIDAVNPTHVRGSAVVYNPNDRPVVRRVNT